MDSYYKISDQVGSNETEIEEKGKNTGGREEQQQRDLHFQSTEKEMGEQESRVEVKIICAWCGKSLGAWSIEASRQYPPGTVSHGICGHCRERFMADLNKSQGGTK